MAPFDGSSERSIIVLVARFIMYLRLSKSSGRQAYYFFYNHTHLTTFLLNSISPESKLAEDPK